MLPALIIFLLTYLLMLALPQYRPFAALGGAALFLALGAAGLWDFTLMDAARAVDFNVLLMMAGTMGTVSLFIESRMPARLAELLIVRVPNVKWAVCMLALFAGVISAFVDNVATVLMVAPVGLAIARKLKISPVPVLISIAVSSNLQGAATLVGDTTSILLGGFAGMNFFHFFWMEGRPGIFFGVELGALASLGVLLFTFRHETQPISATVETEVTDTVPSALMLLTVGLLIAASFLPQPAGGLPLALYGLRSGLICAGDSLYTALGVFLPLIVVNCIILGRAEMFACKNNVVDSALDGIGMGIGYTLTVVLMASIREILGSGTWLGFQVLPESMAKMSIMTQAPGAFFCYGVLMAGCVWLEGKLDARIERKSCCDLDNLKKEAE